MKISEDMFEVERIGQNSKLGLTFFHQNRSCCISIERVQKVTSIGTKIIKLYWPVQKLWHFSAQKSENKGYGIKNQADFD
jgi:hypothetical protein